ncbi:MAG: chromate resistance protein [Cyanobacteria bacterium REEB65]|nr:chromate resistance protein [Cyanobacteria bacterium REEB65]
MNQDLGAGGRTWLLLMHQIPPKPSYLRVKIWRRLQRLGAVALKNSVYALPPSEQAQEDLQWLTKEIVADAGDAFLVEAKFLNGFQNDQLISLFREARDADYDKVTSEARALLDKASDTRAVEPEERSRLEAEAARLRRKLAELERIDFFGASGRSRAREAVSECAMRLEPVSAANANESRMDKTMILPGQVWVTRTGVKVDRIASAWLVRRFIDPQARFKFVAAHGYSPEPGEVRFDMFEAEFTHEGDECTFEVLLRRVGPDSPALRILAEIVHDIDVKDNKFGRAEVPGIEKILAAIAIHADDATRISRGAALFDDLYELLEQNPR